MTFRVPPPARESPDRDVTLPSTTKLILRLKSLLYFYTTPGTFVHCLNSGGFRTPAGKVWSQAAVQPHLDTLRAHDLLGPGERCSLDLLHPTALAALASPEADQLIRAVRRAFPQPEIRYAWSAPEASAERLLRLARLAIYANDEAAFTEAMNEGSKRFNGFGDVLISMFLAARMTVDWIERRCEVMQPLLLSAGLAALVEFARPPDDREGLLRLCEARRDQPGNDTLKPLLVRYDLLIGDLDALRGAIAHWDGEADHRKFVLQGALAFLEGRTAEAVTLYRDALRNLRKVTGRRNIFLAQEHRIFYLLALLGEKDPARYSDIEAGLKLLATPQDQPADPGALALEAALCIVTGKDSVADDILRQLEIQPPPEPLAAACAVLARFWQNANWSPAQVDALSRAFDLMRHAQPLIARIYAQVLVRVSREPAPYRAWLTSNLTEVTLDFTGLVTSQPPWERALAQLSSFLGGGETTKKAAEPARSKRLAWFIEPETRDVEAVEQSAKGKDGWTEGRPVALKRLFTQDARLEYLTVQDRQAAKGIERHYTGSWNAHESFTFNFDRTIVALIGHPCVFDYRHRSRKLELVSYPVELVVTPERGGFRIALSHTATAPTVFLEEETPTRYRVIPFSAANLEIVSILGPDGLHIPTNARDQVIALVQRESPKLPIRAEIAEAATATEGQSTPVVQLAPAGDGLNVSIVVRPFGADGPAYVAGLGGRSVLASIGGKQVRANRDLTRETAERTALIAACPTLRDRLGADAHDVAVDDLDGALELLLELRDYTGPLVTEWPEGRTMRVSPVDAGKMRIRVAQDRDWFSVGGSVTLDEEQVLDMRFLLDRLGQARGRFVPLENGQFVALTRQLQAQLERLAAVSEPHKAGRRVHALGAPALDAVLEDAAEVKADVSWKQHIARIRAAGGYTPHLPATLQAELRDYQVEGFVWMARLAKWGAGACLADDMGLGKTVQTIALLLDRATDGPALVVAPTSVCPNWVTEIARFAPTLRTFTLAADRAETIAALGAGDVLVCSYGLLNQTAEALAAREWQTVVLDEAQAIKNADTKRAQAVSSLRGQFRLALTGTPVENYLDELWSLFNFINPGVLGSRESFQKRFARPIERDRDPAARQALRTLIRPFLLRRTKAAVLSELPPRTEQTMQVQMEDGERSFYEALRRQSLERIAAMDAPTGRRKIQILAEITRLRRACCNPALVDPEAGISSGKLDAFLELTDELIRNRHRALVFSQFVGHLGLVRDALDQRKIRYEYLDGSTPAAEREKRVAAFQTGGSDLFLISLRAGGTGLNLTAADYVVHLDPWWNPAVEDQASDRAHRIGQERPVTIYRLIMQDSIEERILQLHRDKRDLASDILEGGEVSARLSEDDLLDLIRG
jgi:superfamily II DNA or RNA helicase